MASSKRTTSAVTDTPIPKATPAAKPKAVAASSTSTQPAVRKVAAKKPAATKPAAAPATAAKAPARKKAKPAAVRIDAAQRANYIEVAAFYIAERRGFAPGNPEQDYLEAAAEIDRLIANGHFGR